MLYRLHACQYANNGDLSTRNLVALMKRYRRALPRDWDRQDSTLFHKHARGFFMHAHTRAKGRLGRLMTFLWQCWSGGVLRPTDLRYRDYLELARGDGWVAKWTRPSL